MEVLVTPYPGIDLRILGEYSEGDWEQNISPSFEIGHLQVLEGNTLELIEWCDSKKGGALEAIEKLCIQKAKEE